MRTLSRRRYPLKGEKRPEENALKHPDRYTYRDYKTRPEEERWELIEEGG